MYDISNSVQNERTESFKSFYLFNLIYKKLVSLQIVKNKRRFIFKSNTLRHLHL